MYIALHDLGIGCNGSAGYKLYHVGARCLPYPCHRHWRGQCFPVGIILPVAEQRAVNEVPVDKECALQGVDGPARKAHHGVAPSLALHIAYGEVHAANEAHLTVYHHYLAVVAVVDAAGELGEAHRKERQCLYALLAHALEELVANLKASHIVVDEPDLHALSRLVDEQVAEHPPEGIVLEDVDVYVYVAFGSCHGGHQCRKELVAVGIYLSRAVPEGQRGALVYEQVDKLAMLLRQMQVVLFHELQHGAFCQLVHGTLAGHALLASIGAEEEVEHHAYHGHEPYHQCPRHRLCRLTVVHHYVDDDQHHHDVVEYEGYKVDHATTSLPNRRARASRSSCVSLYSCISLITSSMSLLAWRMACCISFSLLLIMSKR